MKWLVAVVLFSCTQFAQADAYLGLGVGRSRAAVQGADQSCAGCSINEVEEHSTVGEAFMGYRQKWLAAEFGMGSLSHYRSHRVGPAADTPFRDIHQEIDTSQVYLRAIAYAPKMFGIEPFASLGYARVKMKNHEWGCNDGFACTFVEQVNYDTRTRPFYGLGFEMPLNRFAIRLETTYVREVAVSRWTLSQNVTAGWLGVIVRMP